MAEMSPLRRRMVEDMTIRNLSPATQQSYIHAVSKFSRHFGHSPDRLGLKTSDPSLEARDGFKKRTTSPALSTPGSLRGSRA